MKAQAGDSTKGRPREHVQLDDHRVQLQQRLEDATVEHASLQEQIDVAMSRQNELKRVIASCEVALNHLDPVQVAPGPDSPHKGW